MSEPTTRFSIVDMHTAGEPVRIVTAGLPQFAGNTVRAKRRDARARFDHLRRQLMLEPRGHAAMYGVLPLAIADSDAALSVLFTHNEGFSTMCGHAVIALGRWVVDTGLVSAESPVTRFAIDCPCGRIPVAAAVDASGRVESTSLTIPDARATRLDAEIDVLGLGGVTLDIGFGGAFYAVLPASRLGLDLFATPLSTLVDVAQRVTGAARDQIELGHAAAADMAFVYGTILTDDAAIEAGAASYNLCAFGGGQVDRSATGSGVAARLALAAARGCAGIGTARTFYGISGIGFGGEVTAASGERVAVRVSGRSHYAGRGELWVEAHDPLASGFEVPERLAQRRQR